MIEVTLKVQTVAELTTLGKSFAQTYAPLAARVQLCIDSEVLPNFADPKIAPVESVLAWRNAIKSVLVAAGVPKANAGQCISRAMGKRGLRIRDLRSDAKSDFVATAVETKTAVAISALLIPVADVRRANVVSLAFEYVMATATATATAATATAAMLPNAVLPNAVLPNAVLPNAVLPNAVLPKVAARK